MEFLKSFHIAAMAFGLAMTSPALADPVKIALDTAADLEQSGTYVWAHTFGTYLKDHDFEVEEFERGALGGEDERLDQISQGLLEVSMSDIKSAGTLDGTIFGIYLPYFFKDAAHLDHALSQGGMLDRINSGTVPKGVRVMDTVYLGLPSGIFTTNKPVTSLADMAGLRMRALDEAQIAIFNAWGAQGTIVAWNEVPNALQTGVADGYLNAPFVPLMFGHTGFIKHFTDAAIMPATRIAIVSEDWYQGLSDEQREIVNAAKDAANAANRNWLKERAGILDDLTAAGVAVVRMTDAERAQFRAASEKLYDSMPMPDGALDAWIASIKD